MSPAGSRSGPVFVGSASDLVSTASGCSAGNRSLRVPVASASRRAAALGVATLAALLLLPCIHLAAQEPDPAATPVPEPSAGPRAEGPVPPANPWAPLVRETLMRQCGTCHRSDLPSARPGALAVFDLREDPWDARLRVEQLGMLLVRIRAIDALPASETEAVERYVRCAREGACSPDVSPDVSAPPP
jgi:hypothetical protein